MGTFTADFQHHQVRAEEEPPGSPGCVGVLQLKEDLKQPEVHEFHRYNQHLEGRSQSIGVEFKVMKIPGERGSYILHHF